MSSIPRTSTFIAFAALAAGCLVATAGATPTAAQRYVSSWAPAYRTFAKVYVQSYRPCLRGATAACGDAQSRAAAAAAQTVVRLRHAGTPPAPLARDVKQLTADLSSAGKRLAASASAARAGNTSVRVWCSAEQGPCTIVMIDIGNLVGDVNFTAGVDLPLPA